MARTDLPALRIRSVGNDPVPPQHRIFVCLGVDHPLFELAHQSALFGAIGLVQHRLIQIDFVLIVVVSVILDKDRAGKDLLDVEQRVDHALTTGFENDVEGAAAHRFEPRAGRHDALRSVEPDLAPFVDEPSPDIFVGLVDIPVQQFETEPDCPASFNRRFASARDFSISGQNPAICCSSSLVAASGEPGKTMPPTVWTLAIFESAGAPCQRSSAKVSARRTRTSSRGFLLWFGVTIRAQFQSLVCTVILSPSAPTSSSTAVGGKLRNSIAARLLRIASTRTACLSA